MAIEFEYGPPPSALGALAYEAGAAEAADRRRREVEQMQMQAAQMRQRQQQATMDRQFSAWRTQYDHHSGLDKMQREHEWKSSFQETSYENTKELYDFEAADKRRAAEMAHIRALEKQMEGSEQIGNRAEVAEFRTKQIGRIEELRRSLNEAGAAATDDAKRRYEKAIGKPNLSKDHKKQARAQYISGLEQTVSNPDYTRAEREWQNGYVGDTSAYGVREVRLDDKTFYQFDPDFDPKKLRVHVGDGFDKDGNPLKVFQVAKITGGQLTYERETEIVGVAPKVDRSKAYNELFEEVPERVWEPENANDPSKGGAWVETNKMIIRLKPWGQSVFTRSGLEGEGGFPSDFNLDSWKDRNKLLEYYINEQGQPAGAGAPAARGAPAAPGAPAAAMVPGGPGSAEEYAAAEAGVFPIGHPGRPETAAERVGGAAARGIGRMAGDMAGAAAQVPGMMARQAGGAIRGAIKPQGVRQFESFVGGIERELQEAKRMNPKMADLLERARNIQDLPQEQLDVLAKEIAVEKAMIDRFGFGEEDLGDAFKKQMNPQR